MKPDSYEASDYAGLEFEGGKFYYGYERTEKDECCFVATVDGLPEIVIPFSKLGARDEWECRECLLIGIGWVLTKYKIGESNGKH